MVGVGWPAVPAGGPPSGVRRRRWTPMHGGMLLPAGLRGPRRARAPAGTHVASAAGPPRPGQGARERCRWPGGGGWPTAPYVRPAPAMPACRPLLGPRWRRRPLGPACVAPGRTWGARRVHPRPTRGALVWGAVVWCPAAAAGRRRRRPRPGAHYLTTSYTKTLVMVVNIADESRCPHQ